MPKIQLFEVDNNYIQYLQQFDNKILNHYGVNYVKSRKYLGILTISSKKSPTSISGR